MVNWGDKYCGGDSSSILLALIRVETVMRATTYGDGSNGESLYQSTSGAQESARRFISNLAASIFISTEMTKAWQHVGDMLAINYLLVIVANADYIDEAAITYF